jgi:hypothetical protein
MLSLLENKGKDMRACIKTKLNSAPPTAACSQWAWDLQGHDRVNQSQDQIMLLKVNHE